MNNVSFTRLLFLSLILAGLSGCGSEGETTESTGVDTSPATGTPGGAPSSTLQFDSDALVVTEGASATITITRTGGSAGAATVTVTSRTGTASAQDYTSLQTTVTFAAGDTAKTVAVATTADDLDEPNETLFVTLSNATGASLGSPAEMVVTIEDDDFTAPPQPTAAMSASYKQLHVDWLGVSGATHYQLLKSTDSGVNFSQVGANLPVTQNSIEIEIVVHTEQWESTAYAIAACNPGGCTRSAALDIANFQPILVGYLKSPQPTNSARFGYAVALSADGLTLAVGTPRDNSGGVGGNPVDDCDANEPVNCEPVTGGVHVYTRSANQWTFQAYLKPAGLEIGSRFGHSVALSGDGNRLVASAPNANPRAVFVFTRTNGAWGSPVLLSNPGAQFDDFGVAIAMSNDGSTLAVGAPYAQDDQLDYIGTVYVFTNDSGAWAQSVQLRAPHTREYMGFGQTVALTADGNTLVVGAPWEDGGSRGIGGSQAPDCEAATPVNCAYGSGATYVFTRTNDTWSAPEYIKSPYSRDGDGFGTTVSLSHDGRLLVIGAPYEDDAGGELDSDCDVIVCTYDTGAAYVYSRAAGSWSNPARLLPGNPKDYGTYGNGVLLSGDGSVLIVAEALQGTGVVTSYARLGDNSWLHRTTIEPSNRTLPDLFGGYNYPAIALSADGNVLAVGAPEEGGASPGFNGNQSNDCATDEPTNCARNSGAVYVYF